MGVKDGLIRRLGFGAARCGLSPPHQAAMSCAMAHGISMYDTAPNYGQDGASERLIGQTIKQLQPRREDLVLSTKFGYYLPRQGSAPGPDSLPVRGSSWHYSIHPDVLRQEIEGSLQRLQQDYVDILYVHAPEHYVADLLLPEGDGDTQETAHNAAAVQAERAKLKPRLVATFAALEGLVSEGKIRGYGVSSNGFATSPSDPAHVSLEEVLSAASEGASQAGKLVPALRAIQLPLNLMEPAGLVLAKAATSRGLDVVGNRPLTGLWDGGLYRLVDSAVQTPPEGYMEACQAVLEYFVYRPEVEDKDLTEEERETRQGCMIVQDLVRELNSALVTFTSYTLFEAELERRIIPLVFQTFESLDEAAVERLTTFFQRYGEMVRYNSALKTRELVLSPACPTGPHAIAESQPLYDYALSWVLAKCPELLSTVLVGMTQEAQVMEALRVVREMEEATGK